MRCEMELCQHWSGDGNVCPCAVLDIEPLGICEMCDSPHAEFAPDPFAAEVFGDDDPVWLCDGCRYDRAMDI